MDLRVHAGKPDGLASHACMFYPNVDMQALNHQLLCGTIYKDHYVAQCKHWMPSRVHEHAGLGATRMSLVALSH